MARVREPIAWTPSKIARVLGFDRKTVATVCAHLTPARTRGRWAYYWLHEVWPQLGGDTPARPDEARALGRKKLSLAVGMAELDYGERLGNLVNKAGTETAAFEEGRRVRDRMMQIPSKLATELALEEDAHSIKNRLDGEIRLALEELAGAETQELRSN